MNKIKRNRHRAAIYRHLSESYYPPGGEIREKMRNIIDDLCEVYPDLVRHIPNGDECITDLQRDFSRLFVGPVRPLAPPYGSVYLEAPGRVMGDSTLEVMGLCREAGLAIDDVLIPDHIAFELEFADYLVLGENSCLENGDKDGILLYEKVFSDFITTHFAKWVHEFAKRVAEQADTVFYRDLAEFTDFFIHEEAGDLRKSPEQ